MFPFGEIVFYENVYIYLLSWNYLESGFRKLGRKDGQTDTAPSGQQLVLVSG